MSRVLNSGWLMGYLAYTNSQESPESFHLWTGISTIAAALRRKVFLSHGYFDVYPNMYIVLTSPPGRCKKSTAMRIGRDIGRQAPGVVYTVDSTSRESLIKDLSQANIDGHSSLTVQSSEMASFFATSGMDMVMFLTDVFDCPNIWAHRTKGSGTTEIKNVWLNIQTGTTPDWLSSAMPLDTIGTGLNSRMIYICETEPRIRPAIATLTPTQKVMQQALITDLCDIANMNGEMAMDPETFKYYNEDWYPHHTAGHDRNSDPKMASYYERKHIHLLKLAMIVSANYSSGMVITMKHFLEAEQILNAAEPKMPLAFSGMGRNPLHADQTQIMQDLLTRREGVSRAELLIKFSYNLRVEELDEIIQTLIATGRVVSKGSPARYYAAAISDT